VKKKIFLFTAGLFLLMPSFGLATESVPNMKQEIRDHDQDKCHHEKHGDMLNKNWQEKIQAKEQQLLQWVDQYTPEKKAEWTKVVQEEKTLREKWLSPEFAKQRELWKKEKMAEMQELKKLYEEGKLTKEELISKAHGGKDFAHWKTFHELKEAVDEKDTEEVKQLLNQLLVQHKEHNEMVKQMLKQKPQQ
jgi:hypothetical protein